MFWAGIGEKCIIMQFLEGGKDRKTSQRRDAEAQRKDLRRELREEKRRGS
jgi:hypothetical protein